MVRKVAARTLDFSNVKESSGINPKHVEDGDYLAKVIEVRDDPAKDGEAMWLFIFKLADNTTATYPYYCKLVDNQLWKLRNLWIAAGVDLPKRAVKIDPNRVIGKEVGLVLEGEEFEGKMKSVISAIIPKSDLPEFAAGADEEDDEDEDDEEEEVVPVKRGRGRPKKVVVEEEEDDEDDEEEEEPAPVKRGRGRPRKVVEPEEDEDDEDEDEEPAPVKRGRGRPRKVAAAPVRKKRRVADDDDDLDLDL